ncbi:MAG TPA: nicotinate phosphoribosyltransferase [Planctomycetota bacterium]|nr:nicotinate phosphoribosyltransferase [Planctomycetota bacterium]
MAANIYLPSAGLLTDLYQLTMAYGYWKLGRHEQRAVFHLSFRRHPFGGGFSVACGLEYAIAYLRELKFTQEDTDYLATLQGNDGKPLFEPAFFEYLRQMKFSCDVAAIPEGTVVFPHEPLLRITGPILQCQILETPLLNLMNFSTLIATKAARICLATKGEPVLEFGLRRAQGVDGALMASRAAYIGGCSATSNVLAGKLFGIPVKGTHAHSWVMSFEEEIDAFDSYARALPNNCVFLVDTYDTLEGVRKACTIGKKLRSSGHKLGGIRLDSGDLAWLSIEARRILDAEGFHDAVIVASNDLDEQIIASLKEQGAKIAVWGVGTRLVTSYDQPALGGVYKLSAIRVGEQWQYRIKISEQAVKTSLPGILQVRRFKDGSESIGDMIFNTETGAGLVLCDPADITRRKAIPNHARHEDLLVNVFEKGNCVYKLPQLADIQARTRAELASFYSGVKRFINPHTYPVGLDRKLHELRTELILKARGAKVAAE